MKPMEQLEKDIKYLTKEKERCNSIKKKLQLTQDQIVATETEYKQIEWEYEVKLQQFQYLEKEKKQLFEEFHKVVYEVHQKAGLKNLLLEKKLETI
jgi:hypothetical protein